MFRFSIQSFNMLLIFCSTHIPFPFFLQAWYIDTMSAQANGKTLSIEMKSLLGDDVSKPVSLSVHHFGSGSCNNCGIGGWVFTWVYRAFLVLAVVVAVGVVPVVVNKSLEGRTGDGSSSWHEGRPLASHLRGYTSRWVDAHSGACECPPEQPCGDRTLATMCPDRAIEQWMERPGMLGLKASFHWLFFLKLEF